MKKLAVMVSGGGTNLQAIIDAAQNKEIDAKVAVVISNKEGVYALERAEKAGIPTRTVLLRDCFDTDEFAERNIEILKEFDVDGVVLAGYLAILAPAFIREYRNKIINIHPSLIPSFCGKGYYGGHVHRAVIEYGAKVSGATVHFVDEGADTGPIIMQKAVPVLDDDTPEELAARILVEEHKLLTASVKLFCEDKLRVEGRRVRVLK